MASTFTTFANLEKFEDRSVGWDFGANLDTIDQGINVVRVTAGEDISAYDLVRWDTTGDTQVLQAQLSDEDPACGIALSGISSTGQGLILTRGFVVNTSWTWTRGTVLYLDNTPGGLVKAGTTHALESASSSERLLMQPVGVAVESDRVWFNFDPSPVLMPFTLTPDSYAVTVGSATQSFKAITGPGNAMVLSGSSATIVFTYTLPAWFSNFPNIAGIWGFRAQYIAASGGTIDVATVYDGVGNSGTPVVTAGASTTWTNFDMDWDAIYGVAGLTPTAGKQMSVSVTLSGANVDVEINPRLRFEPLPTIFG